MRIWLVDDSPAELMLLERAVLSACPDAQLTRFTTVAAALDRWRLETPQAIIVDLNLPGESGLDLVRCVDTALDRDPVSVALLTGVRPPTLVREQLALCSSPPHVLVKPLRAQHVSEILTPLEMQR